MSTLKVNSIEANTGSEIDINSTLGTIPSIIISGVTTVAAGSAAAPSITPTGDSNTGIFFPSADTIAIAEGGTEALRIDSSGRVTMPYQPSFFAYATGNDTTVADATIIVFGATSHNVGSHYSTSTGRFTAPVTGVYAFHAQIWAKNGAGYSRAIFRAAGALVTQNGFHPNTVGNNNDHSFQMSMVRQVSAGDAVDVMTNLGPLTFYGGGAQSHSYFCGYLIG